MGGDYGKGTALRIAATGCSGLQGQKQTGSRRPGNDLECLPHTWVHGSVQPVLARYLGVQTPNCTHFVMIHTAAHMALCLAAVSYKTRLD